MSEVGELAKDATRSAEYGRSPAQFSVESDEIGDVLFALLAFMDAMDIDAEEALHEALQKYEARIDRRGSPTSEERA